VNTPTQHTPASQSVALDSPEFLADPFPFYERLRRETPVYRTRMGYLDDAEVYFLSRYSDCVAMTTELLDGFIPGQRIELKNDYALPSRSL